MPDRSAPDVTSAPADPPGTSFAQQLRAATAGEHAAAEASRLAARLVAGDIDVDAYAVLAVQLRAVYAALEEVVRGVASDPVAGAFADRGLERTAALDDDLVWLTARASRPIATDPLPATRDYVARLREVATWPGGVVAHHYTRYLGDLSGGAVIGRSLARTFGGGVAFYRFPGIDPRTYKAAYRARLDAAAWSSDERERITAEVVSAYRCNARLFGAVDQVTRDAGGAPRAAEVTA